jgi:hypothetical protein
MNVSSFCLHKTKQIQKEDKIGLSLKTKMKKREHYISIWQDKCWINLISWDPQGNETAAT